MTKLLVGTAIVEIGPDHHQPRALVSPAGRSVSSQTLRFVTQHLAKHRRTLRTRWRVLSSTSWPLMVEAHLRKGETYQNLALGFGVGTTTAYRCLRRPRRPSTDPGS